MWRKHVILFVSDYLGLKTQNDISSFMRDFKDVITQMTKVPFSVGVGTVAAKGEPTTVDDLQDLIIRYNSKTGICLKWWLWRLLRYFRGLFKIVGSEHHYAKFGTKKSGCDRCEYWWNKKLILVDYYIGVSFYSLFCFYPITSYSGACTYIQNSPFW